MKHFLIALQRKSIQKSFWTYFCNLKKLHHIWNNINYSYQGNTMYIYIYIYRSWKIVYSSKWECRFCIFRISRYISSLYITRIHSYKQCISSQTNFGFVRIKCLLPFMMCNNPYCILYKLIDDLFNHLVLNYMGYKLEQKPNDMYIFDTDLP